MSELLLQDFMDSEKVSSPLVKKASLRPSSDAPLNKFQLRSRLAKTSWQGKIPAHQVRFCGIKAIPAQTKKADGSWVPTGMPGEVQIHRYEVPGTKEGDEPTYKHGYYGMYHCGSALICPVCGPIIQARRSEEVVQGGIQLLKRGYQVGMVTQTASHHSRTSLYDFVLRFQAAQRDLKSWRAYKKWKEQTGARFTIRSVETTDDNPDWNGRKTGWHFHSHTLIFFDRPNAFSEEEAEKYTKIFQKLWVCALNKVGLSGSLERAAVFSLPRATDALDRARKASSDPAEDADVVRLCKYVAKAFSYEISTGAIKEGRDGDRRINIWQLQHMALTTHPHLLSRYGEYMRAMRGISWLRWSQGLKDFCKISDISDQDIMRGKAGELVYTLGEHGVAAIARFSFYKELIEIADAAQRDAPAAIDNALFNVICGIDPKTGERLNE